MKQSSKSAQPDKPALVLPNILLLPAPHHKRWGWLIWTILILGVIFGLLWLIRGCKPAPAPISNAETPRAYYGKFDVLEGGPSPLGGTGNYQQTDYYHRALPDGRILFVASTTSLVKVPGFASEVNDYSQNVFFFDPTSNQFQDSPVKLSDNNDLNAYQITKAGQLAIFSLDQETNPKIESDIINGTGTNPKLSIYDPSTGDKTEVTPAEDLSGVRFDFKPYIFEVDGGILIDTMQVTNFEGGQVPKFDSAVFFYNYQTKQLTRKVGSIGLQDRNNKINRRILPLNDNRALVMNGNDLYLFDYRTKTASFKRRLTAYQQGVLNARLVPNTSLVYITVSDSIVTNARSVVYLYNFETNQLFSYRLGDKPLRLGLVKDVADARQGIPRDNPTLPDQSTPITDDTSRTFWLQPLLDGTVLVTSNLYYNLPWSYGLMGALDNQWLARVNSAEPEATDPKNNYADQLSAILETNSSSAYSSTIQDSMLLPDGRVLFAGGFWFTYTPDSSKTSFQSVNPTTFGSRLGQLGHWAEGGKLLAPAGININDAVSHPELASSADAYGSFGTPYPLKDGRVFFYKPQYASPRNGDRNNRPIFKSDIIGQLYDSSTGKSHWVKSSAIKNLKYPVTVSPSAETPSGSSDIGIVDDNGNLHIFGYFGLPAKSPNELIYYPASGKTILRKAVDVTYPTGENVQLSWMLAGLPVAVGDSIYFFDGQTVFVLDVKTGQYDDMQKRLQADVVKQNPKTGVTPEALKQIRSKLPVFDGGLLAGDGCAVITTAEKPAGQCVAEAALSLGNRRILVASGNLVKIFNYQTITTETLPKLKNLTNVKKLFRMSDGRVAIVGEAALPTGKTLSSGSPEVDTGVPVIEILDIGKQTVSEPITSSGSSILPNGLAEISDEVWSLPNDRLLFAIQGGTRLSLYDLQNQRWLSASEALTNINYRADLSSGAAGMLIQSSDRPTIIKLASELGYRDYTKELANNPNNPSPFNASVLAPNDVELFIPETGPWGYADVQVNHFNWWLWFLTLQLMQGLAGLIIILTRHKTVRRFLIPL